MGCSRGGPGEENFGFSALWHLLIMVSLLVMESWIIAGTGVEPDFDPEGSFLVNVYFLLTLIPTLGLNLLGDCMTLGNSGWWQLIVLLPIIGAIGDLFVMLVLTSGDEGENKYGPNPIDEKSGRRPH